MAEQPTSTPNSGAPAGGAATAQPQPQNAVPAKPDASLLGAATPTDGQAQVKLDMPQGFEGGADAWGKLDDAGKASAITAATDKTKAESAARKDAYGKAQGKDARLAAYNALDAEEKAEIFKAMSEADRKELGVEDPAIPQYTDFKLPDGYQADPERMKSATDLFKELRLPQEQAQKLIDLATSNEIAAAQKSVQAFVDLQNNWVSEIKADPDIGGPRLTASLAAASRAIDRLAIPGLKDALNLTGAGNNPAIVKAFVRIGQLLTEDRFAPGRSPAPAAPRSAAEILYDATPKTPE